MRRSVAALGFTFGLAACGSPDPVEVELTVSPGDCDGEACRHTSRGSGLIVWSEDDGGAGYETLYTEAALPNDTTAVVEIRFAGDTARRVRYREVHNGEVKFRGRVTDAEVRRPRHDGVTPIAGRFHFVAVQGEEQRVVDGVILPATGEPVRLDPDSQRRVRSETYVSCEGEVYVPPPVPDGERVPLPDDPWTPDPVVDPNPVVDPEPDPSTAPDEPVFTSDPPDPEGEEPGDDEWFSSPPPPPPSDSGCEGDDYESEPAAPADSGCEGDSYDDGSTMASDSGCEGDSYDDGSTMSSDSGCEGDDYDSGSDSGCEGDSYEMAAVLPVLGSLWRLGWPLGLAGVFNRRARWRRRR